jgi:hypothetical protein
MKISDYICFAIIRDFKGTLNKGELGWILLWAISLASVIFYFKVQISGSLIGTLLTALSVFCALLFGLLVPTLDLTRRLYDRLKKFKISSVDNTSEDPQVKLIVQRMELNIELSKDIFKTLSFSIYISILGVLSLVIMSVIDPFKSSTDNYKDILMRYSSIGHIFLILTAFCGFCMSLFLLSVFRILRYMHTIFLKEVEDSR